AGLVVIHPACRVHDYRHQQSQGIDGDVPLAAGDLFAAVVAAFFAAFRRTDGLTVDDSHTGSRFLAVLPAHFLPQRIVNPLPNAGLSPTPRSEEHTSEL